MAKANDQPSPVGGLTKEALSSYRRQARDRGRGSVSGIRFEVADLIAARTNKDTLRGLRDAAIVRVMSDGLLRVSELVDLEIRDFEFAGDGSATINMRHSKADQEAEGATLYVGEHTAELVEQWLKALRRKFGIREGRLFRSVKKGEGAVGESISVKAVQLIVKQVADEAHLPGRFGTHSFRIGSAESLAERGCSLPQLMQIGRWSSSEMVGHYTRKQLASRQWRDCAMGVNPSMFTSKVIRKFGLGLAILVITGTMTRGQDDVSSWIERIDQVEIEVWECFDSTEFSSWKIFEESDKRKRPRVLVNLVGALLPSVGRTQGIGTIKIGMVEHVGVFKMEGLTREWRWWGGGGSNYAFVIEPEGDARYYEFRGEESTTPTSLLGCELSNPTTSEERAAKMRVIQASKDAQ